MDIYAFLMGESPEVQKYLTENYGEIPRFRGVRFMKTQEVNTEVPDEEKGAEELMFDKYCSQDVIYIHTRCGNCGDEDYEDEESNYVYCGGKEWEESLSDLFLDHITEEFDRTYCTHYFKAVINEDYNRIINLLLTGE